MITGIESFQEWFHGYEEQYVIIGGTACDLLFADEGIDFRATKDIDLVLIVEAVIPEFGRRFWEYIIKAGYEYRNKSTGKPQFYRFSHPVNSEFPFMLELFSRRVDTITLPEDAVLTPLAMEEDVSSLSAILLDDDYYNLLQNGRKKVNGVMVLDAAYLILFKAKAWNDLTDRRARGEHVDSKNIKKHKNDVFRLFILLNPDVIITVNQIIYRDMQNFINAMRAEEIDFRQLGIRRTKETVLQLLESTYIPEK